MITVNEDTLMHWRGCLVKLESLEDSWVIFDEDTHDTGDSYSHVVYLKNKHGEELSLSEGETFDPIYPRMGYRNKGKVCFFVSRSNERTYRKGISLDTVKIFFPQQEELSTIDSWVNISSFDLIDQEYPSLSEAKELILSKDRWSVAFHRYYAFVLKVGHDRPVLYYKFYPQGFLNSDGSIEFLRGEDKFKMELKYGNIK